MNMGTFVTITAQGQISIPARLRRALGLERFRKALVNVRDDKIIIEPVGDVVSLAGVLSQKKMKGKTINMIIKEEEEGIARAIAERHSR